MRRNGNASALALAPAIVLTAALIHPACARFRGRPLVVPKGTKVAFEYGYGPRPRSLALHDEARQGVVRLLATPSTEVKTSLLDEGEAEPYAFIVVGSRTLDVRINYVTLVEGETARTWGDANLARLPEFVDVLDERQESRAEDEQRILDVFASLGKSE